MTEGHPEQSGDARLAVETAGLTTVFAALLYYFGWARTAALYHYFGIASDLLDFGTRDYVLRSMNAAIRPLGVALAVVAAAVPLHSWVVASARGRQLLRYASWAFVSLGALFMVIREPFGLDWPIAPVTLLTGVILVLARSAPGGRLRRFTSLALAVLLGIWSTAAYASYRGTRDALRLVEEPGLLPAVTVHSTDDLGLGPAVTRNPAPDGVYRFRYDRLRLLVRTGDRHLLLPDGWQRGRPVLVLTENDKLRFEYARRP